MISEKLIEILTCPKCKGEIKYIEEKKMIICQKCRLKFKIIDNIPIMLLDEAEDEN